MTIKQNSVKAWFLAIRPKTLTGAAAPVLIALALSYEDSFLYRPAIGQTSVFQWIPAVLCLLFAMLMQIDANLINDYFDCINGVDGEDRLGPKRACAQGWVSMYAMQRAIAFTTCISLVVALPTIYWGGWEMLIVGVLCALFAFLYTTCLARLGLGDLLVLVFFGLVPVCITYYVQLHCIPRTVLALATGMGLVTDNLLIVNNYRDRDTDLKAGKHTLIVSIGPKAAEWLYLALGVAGVAFCQWQWTEGRTWGALLPILYLIPHFIVWRKMVKINHGKELNKILGMTALNIFLFALLAAIGTVL
ncbi:MAG: 1,4-dihydroxy-2-naphthoate octaprenyltransferase [Bacteroidales bacterium]|nr:1,4-dihydroxy-2-naphthoate octaprenyltransferase [Bacteroidales bacterium]